MPTTLRPIIGSEEKLFNLKENKFFLLELIKIDEVQKNLENENINFNNIYILEKLVKLKKEISVIITRFKDENYEIYEPIENMHENQILKTSKIPADINNQILDKSKEKLESEIKIGNKSDFKHFSTAGVHIYNKGSTIRDSDPNKLFE